MIKNKRIIPLSLSFLGACLLIFLFTNMNKTDWKIENELKRSEYLASKINEVDRSELSKKYYLKLKNQISNYISIKTKPKNCKELIQIDPALTTGTYLIYPNQNTNTSSVVQCVVNNGKLLASEFPDRKITNLVCPKYMEVVFKKGKELFLITDSNGCEKAVCKRSRGPGSRRFQNK